mmetsp:Transcript_696/g.883  ORF Transcript_696/g.883 Transcript_696/m.883 type:complete len:81 (-) Transcript_696:145-387(-)
MVHELNIHLKRDALLFCAINLSPKEEIQTCIQQINHKNNFFWSSFLHRPKRLKKCKQSTCLYLPALQLIIFDFLVGFKTK